MPARRILVPVSLAIVIIIIIVLLIIFLTGTSHTYKLRFQNAGQLVSGNSVEVGGRSVGSVKGIILTNDNQAEITISVNGEVAPLHQGTTAVIRAQSLSGIANRYIALSPGPNNAPKIPDNGIITSDKTTSPVELDALLDTLNASTRRNIQKLIQGEDILFRGKAVQINQLYKFLNPAVATTARVVSQLSEDETAFTNFVVNSSKVVTALDQRKDQLTQLIGNANTTLAAISSERQALDQTLDLLPGTLNHANRTLPELRSTVDNLDQLVEVAKPATRRLTTFSRQLRLLLVQAVPVINSLRKLITAVGANNDLLDLFRILPRVASIAIPTFSHTTTALRQALPIIEFIRPYAPELVGWFRDFGQGASNYDANGHYARIVPVTNSFRFTKNARGGVLTPQPITEKMEGLHSAKRRCPGSASQPPPDGSAPFTDNGRLDCRPNEVPPGP